MRSMSLEQAQSYRMKKKSEFFNDLRWYHQPVTDITVTTTLENGVEVQRTLNGQTSRRKSRMQEPITRPYRICTAQDNTIYSVNEHDWKVTQFQPRVRMDSTSLLAYVCSSLKQQGWTKQKATEWLWKHWDKLEAIEDES